MSACANQRSPAPSILRPAAELCALAALLAGLAALVPDNWLPAPAAPPAAAISPYVLNLAQIRALPHIADALWLDARGLDDYAAGHVPGALHFTEADWEAALPVLIERWQPDAPIIVYCDTAACGTAARVAARLRRELAYDNIHALDGGWPAWSPLP